MYLTSSGLYEDSSTSLTNHSQPVRNFVLNTTPWPSSNWTIQGPVWSVFYFHANNGRQMIPVSGTWFYSGMGNSRTWAGTTASAFSCSDDGPMIARRIS